MPEQGSELLGRTVDGEDVNLDTTSLEGTFESEVVRITGSLGSDGVVRMVLLTAADITDLDELRSELVNSIRFLRVPSPEAADGG